MLALLPVALALQLAAAPDTQKPTVKAVIKTSMGVIELELDRKKAPLSVDNFVKYAKDGQYTKTIFHRVISNFMIQGGGLDDKMKDRPVRAPVPNESLNGLQNLRGTIAMARTSNPDSATCQFYINLKDNNFLDGQVGKPGYTVFGKVVKGMDVVDKIAASRTGNAGGMPDVPVAPVYIESVTVE
ncbi:MAG: peptidylprolyl isomerase [Deltaproteobacteria bacterium]|nr:peptidylprolyl isomerase [Deltaproteobacteria bacterium]